MKRLSLRVLRALCVQAVVVASLGAQNAADTTALGRAKAAPQAPAKPAAPKVAGPKPGAKPANPKKSRPAKRQG